MEDFFHFNCFSLITVFSSDTLKFSYIPADLTGGRTSQGAGDFHFSSSTLGVQVLSYFLSHFLSHFLLSFVLLSFVKIFLLYLNPEVFCQCSTNSPTFRWIFNVGVGKPHILLLSHLPKVIHLSLIKLVWQGYFALHVSSGWKVEASWSVVLIIPEAMTWFSGRICSTWLVVSAIGVGLGTVI